MIALRAFIKIATIMSQALPAWLAIPLIAHSQIPIWRYNLNSQAPAGIARLPI